MRVAVLCNVRPRSSPAGFPDDVYEEYDSISTIDSICAALRALQIDVEPVEADARLPWRLSEKTFDFAFNIAEGSGRRCREAIPAAVCELLGLPFTGSDALTLSLTLDKFLAKRVVCPDVPVAAGIVYEIGGTAPDFSGLRFPVIVKPNDEGSSKGIRADSVCANAVEALDRLRRLQHRYDCPVLIEEFAGGAEVTVAVTGNGSDVRILGMMEIAPVSSHPEFVYSMEIKRDWTRQVRYYIPPRLSAKTVGLLEGYAIAAYRLLGCRDIARMDFRMDGETPRFIECNPLPGLDPVNSDIVIMSKDRLPYQNLVQGILHAAMRRVRKEL